jgi:protein tyrosine phosphatase (PTP) superfamily phosphohydrolase (DUF442 family)
MIQRFSKVTDNVYRGGAPTIADVILLNNKLGIKKIISLDELSGKHISNITRSLGMKHIFSPIDWTNASLLNIFSYNFKDLFLTDGPVFIHCKHGKDRTGLIVAVFKCKCLGEDPEIALEDAKSFGFGGGLKPQTLVLFENIIRKCKPLKNDNNNNADIVSNQREQKLSIMDPESPKSFAPHLDQTKQYPNQVVYNSVNDQSTTRENFNQEIAPSKNKNVIPLIGVYNNNAGIHGAGPTEPAGGFIYN